MADDGSFDNKKAGIPLWAWVTGGAALLAVGWFWYKNKSSKTTASNNAASTTSASTSNTDTSGLATDQYEVLLSQLRDLQGEEAAQPPATQPVQSGPVTTPAPPTPTSPPSAPTPVSPTPSPATQNTVTVAAWPAWNSTLWGIALKEYGDGSQYPKIFSANQQLILGQEMAHGMSSADAQAKKFLYPGEVLTIP